MTTYRIPALTILPDSGPNHRAGLAYWISRCADSVEAATADAYADHAISADDFELADSATRALRRLTTALQETP